MLLGLEKAIKITSITHFLEMDADLSHDASQISRLIEKSKDSDVVIGSRYMKGSIIKNWPKSRLILSRIVNTFFSQWFGLSITDYTNGFRLYNRKAVQILLSSKLYETGFIGLSETAYVLKQNGCTISEVPITFSDRKFGLSSAGISEHIDAIRGALRIKRNHKK